MKSNYENTKMAAILTVLLGLAFFSAQVRAEPFEEEDSSISFDDSGIDGGDALNSETIDVDGAFSYREQMEQHRKRNRIRREERREENRNRREENMALLQDRHNERLEVAKAKTEQNLQNKIGTIRIKSEKRLLKKLFNKEREESFNDGASTAIPVPVIPTAPIAIVTAPMVEESPPMEKTENPVDIGISFTSSHFDGKDVEMSSDSGFNLTISRKIVNNFSMGLSGGITSMSILVKDQAPSSYALGNVDTDYQRFHVELTGKTFFAATSLLRPYVQLSLGYNKVSLNLDEDQVKDYRRRPRSPYRSARYYRHRYNTKEETSNDENTEKLSKYILSGTTQVGVAFMFSQNLGLDLSAGYRYNFTTPFKNVKIEHSRRYYRDDRQKKVLANLGQKLEKSGEVSLNAGFILRF